MKFLQAVCLIILVSLFCCSMCQAEQTYIVQPKDTLWSISKKFNVPIEDLIKANNLSDVNVLKAGQTLIIPTATPKATPTPAPAKTTPTPTKTTKIDKVPKIKTIITKTKIKTKPIAIVAKTVAGIHKEPSFRSEMETQVILGQHLVIISDTGSSWLKVKVPDGYTGWIASDYVKKESSVNLSGKLVFVTAMMTQVRQKPTEKSSTIQNVVLGSTIATTGKKSGNWQEVTLPKGEKGYVPVKDIDVHPANYSYPVTNPQKVIEMSMRFLGVPYLWGGVSPLGADCSGFTYTVFRLNGIHLLRDADQQYTMGTKVERNELKQGDLVFFSTYRTGASHVGIYLGGGKFIHASSSGGIKISNLSEDYFNKRYLGAKRYFKEGKK